MRSKRHSFETPPGPGLPRSKPSMVGLSIRFGEHGPPFPGVSKAPTNKCAAVPNLGQTNPVPLRLHARRVLDHLHRTVLRGVRMVRGTDAVVGGGDDG